MRTRLIRTGIVAVALVAVAFVAVALEAASGAEWRCPGATRGSGGRWPSWAR